LAVKIKDQHEEIYVPALDLTFTSFNFGWSRFICRGEIIMTCLSSVRAWREKSGLDIKKLSLEYQEEFSNAYGKTMIITLSDGTELDAWVESQRFKHIVFAPRPSSADWI